MTISIDNTTTDFDSDTYSTFDVHFYEGKISTLVTHDPDTATEWLSDIRRDLHHHRSGGAKLVVGIDVEWRPSNRQYDNPAATLQLCVGKKCLIFQLIHAPHIPQSLIDFLADEERYTFAGVGVSEDLERLEEDYGFGGKAKYVDVRVLAANHYERRELNRSGLKELTRVVLGKDLAKPKRVTMSRWDWRWLKEEQIQYACIDAFVSYEIGRVLNAAASSE